MTVTSTSAKATMRTRGQGHATLMEKICQLDDTPDEDTSSYDGDKENEVNTVRAKQNGKRKDIGRASREGKKGLSKRQKVSNSTENAVDQESPPSFAYKTTKTSFRKRKLIKQKLEEEEMNKKRIEDLVAYFKNLDEQKLETA